MHPAGALPSLMLKQFYFQRWKSQAIHVAATLHLAEAPAEGPHTVAQLAEATGTHAPSLYRLLRALASIGIVIELDGPRFVNSELSYFLRPNVPGSIYAMVTSNIAQAAVLSGVRTVVDVGGGLVS